MARTPHGYGDPREIARDLANGGFSAPPAITAVDMRSRASSPRIPALAYCQGTPLRNEIEARDASRMEEATNAVEGTIAARFGDGPVEGKMSALVISIEA